MRAVWPGIALTALVACGGAQHVRPDEMSASGHDEQAVLEEQRAREDFARYDPNAAVQTLRCPGATEPSSGPFEDGTICWTSSTNPTQEALAEARRHREHAAEHRAAARALRDAEDRACANVPPRDRDMSPFAHREDIAGVEELDVEAGGKVEAARVGGAIVTFRAVPGMTAEWLQRVVDCHVARNAAMGHDVPEMSYCPLVPRSVHASVTAVSGGFAVTIRADDPEAAREVLRRARALVAR